MAADEISEIKLHRSLLFIFLAEKQFLNPENAQKGFSTSLFHEPRAEHNRGGGPMSPVWILKRLVSVFINACRLLSALLSLSQFGRGWRVVVSCSDFILLAVATFWAMSLVRIYPGRASYKLWTFFCYGENCLMAGKSLFMTNALLKPYFIISVTVFNSCVE